jgi:hypothetical protein
MFVPHRKHIWTSTAVTGINKNKTNAMPFSMQVNYTDCAKASDRRILVQTFADRGVSRGQRGGNPTSVNQFSRPEPLLFFQVAPHLCSRGWVDPLPDPQLLRKYGSAGNRIRDLWICSQELWPLCCRDSSALLLCRRVIESLCDWRSVGQYVLVSSPTWGSWPDVC